MQVEQLRTQNSLLQQLVSTLQREIQSKNQEQNIMIQELQHLIKDNDSLSGKYNFLLIQSRNWNQKEKYYERVIKEIEDALARTRYQLSQTQKKLSVQSQPLLTTSHLMGINPNGVNALSNGLSQSSPQIQVLNPQKSSSHMYISVPKLNMIRTTSSVVPIVSQNNLSQTITPAIYQPQPSPSQHQSQQPIAIFGQPITSLEQEIKSLKAFSQSLKLQINHKNIQLNSKTQQIHQMNIQLNSLRQQLSMLQDNQQNFKLFIDELRGQNQTLTKEYDQIREEVNQIKKENQDLLNDLQQKQSEINQKDQKFFSIYKEVDDQWKNKMDKAQKDNQNIMSNLIDLRKHIQAKDQEINTLHQAIFNLNQEMQNQNNIKSQQKNTDQESNKTYYEMMNHEIEMLRARNKELQESRDHTVKQIRGLAAEVVNQKIILQEKQGLLAVLQTGVSQLKGKIDYNQTQLKLSQDQLLSAHNQSDLLKNQLIQLQNSLLLLEEDKVKLTEERSRLIQQKSQAKSSLEQTQKQLTESQNVSFKSQQIVKQLEQQNNNLVRQIQSLKSFNQNLTTELQSSKAYLRILQHSLTSPNQLTHHINQNKQQNQIPQNQKKDQMESLEKENTQLREQLNQFAKNFEDIAITVQQMRNSIEELQLKLHQKDTDIQHKQKQIKNRQQENAEILSQNEILKSQLQSILTQNSQLKQKIQLIHQQNSKSQQLQSFPNLPSSSSQNTSTNLNHIDLEIFQVLQQEYTKLYEETEEMKQQQEEEKQGFLVQIKQREEEISQLKRKIQDLTNLFSQKHKEHQQLSEQYNQKLMGSIDKIQSSNSKIVANQNNQDMRPSLKLTKQQQPFSRQLLRNQQKNPSPQRYQQFSRPIISSNCYTQNLVENNLSSARSHEQKTPNQHITDQINEVFDVRIQPTQRKSDLPVHSVQFIEKNIQSNKPIRPKSNITQAQDSNSIIRNQNVQTSDIEVDINFLRNSIAEFGIDIDFNAIAKHIGLQVAQQEDSTNKRLQEKTNRSKQTINNKIITPSNQQEDIRQETQEDIIVSKQSIQNNNSTNRDKELIKSSCNKSKSSQKRSTPSGLRVPHLDEELMRSSYGSNNQFTQIVLYYEEELSKLRRQIQELTEEVEKLRIIKDENGREQLIVKEQNEENPVRVQMSEIVLKDEIDLKQKDINLQNQSKQSQNMHQVTFTPLQQHSEFRTSIQPGLTHNYLQPSSNKPILFTPQEQQETVELIKELSSQLEAIGRRLNQKENELEIQMKKIELLESENSTLNGELDTVKKENQTIATQFSQLSLHQNTLITELQTKLQLLNNQLNQTKLQLNTLNCQNHQLVNTNELLTSKHQQKTKQFQTQLSSKELILKKVTNQNVQYETQLLHLNQQVQQLQDKIEQMSQIHQKNTNQKDLLIKKLQKTLKEMKDQSTRLTNQNQTLAKEFSKLINSNTQLQTLSQKYHQLQTINQSLVMNYNTLQSQCKTLESTNKSLESTNKSLESHNKLLQSTIKTLQQKLTRLTTARRQGSQSPAPSVTNQRMSDLIEPSHQICPQQNLTINNISNIHAFVDQLGDDSFVLHEKDKEISVLKDKIEKQRKEIQQLGKEASERESYVREVEDKLANIQNSFNSEIMDIKKQNAQMNAELLKLKKELFNYQKETWDIDKFIQENFLKQKPSIPKRFSAQGQQEDRFQSVISHQINRSQKSNNSFNFEPQNSHEMNSLSGRNRVNMTQFYNQKDRYPKEKQQPKGMNMGELFVGHKTRPRQFEINRNENSLSQLIKNITSGNKQKSFTQVIQPGIHKQQSNYSKYLTEYEKFEQKVRLQSFNKPSYQLLSHQFAGHVNKCSDHGEE